MAVSKKKQVVSFWLDELRSAREREDRFRKDGQHVIDIYEADKEEPTPFNILYSNTETLLPSLFSAQPRPVVWRRYKDEDPLGKMAADADTRMLEYLMDTNREGYETISEAMEAVVLDSLLPGRGVVALKYDADFVEFAESRPPEEDDTKPPKKVAKRDAEDPAVYAKNELVCPESIVWNKVLFGHAKKWHQVPWMAYEFHLTKEQVAKKIGVQESTLLKYTSGKQASIAEEKPEKDDEHLGARKTALVYQIWDKAGGRTIKYVAPTYTDGILKEEPDPLGLTGFFNTPRPLMFVGKSWSIIPTAPYAMYKTQAQELNRLTQRIARISEAIKVRGAYDGSLKGDLEKIFSGADNELVPTEVASSLATEKGFQNAIWTIPVDQLIIVLRELLQARESVKQVIYEITGISDIVRGATQASETATAQQLKSQWGTLRLKRMQKEVARYVRDLLRMMTEIAASKFSEETWAQITGLPFVTSTQRQQLEMQAAVMQQMDQAQQQALQAELQKPVWQQILQLLKDDNLRAYKIDIETNSTIEPEAAEDQKNIADLLTALSQYLQGVGPLVVNGTMPFEAAQAMMLAIARRFRFGHEIEDSLKAMQAPKPQDDGGKAEAAAQQKQMEMDGQMQQKELAVQKKEAELELQAKAMQAEHQQRQREMDLDLREAELKIKEHQHTMNEQVSKAMLEVNRQRAGEELEHRQKRSELDRRTHMLKEQTELDRKKALVNEMEQAMVQIDEISEALSEAQQETVGMQAAMAQLGKLVTAKRVKTPIRGMDGRIERVEESLDENADLTPPEMPPPPESSIGAGESGTARLKAMGQALATVRQQTQEMQQAMAQLAQLVTAKRIKTPIRGQDGRIERVEETLEETAA